jgi:putative tricarboxylic transport membrane protein
VASGHESGNGDAVSRRTMEIVVGLALLGLGAIVVADSLRVGITWASDGPRPGYFPFYVGLFLMGSSATAVAVALFDGGAARPGFVSRRQIVAVLQLLLPAAVFILAIGWIGMYLASALYIGAFMAWLGRYPLWKIAPVSVAVPVAFFLMFEIWFLVPLPKGPIEGFLGY